ncbi:undecaprenyl-phosphate glucose phosphotransferase [Pedobacter sp. SYSU D00535]|uniref:undecaprenyl-phosphate glucose phosphotransferase n=1 Tax=Pedobacter sp. SYSU D00535 TaxID=2810308 RepID=UPI001A96AAAC|nr:undecaprenyl-phosphate glucose phosphotransferase [Pedobacter sp. SYSU D00535]
MQTRYLYLLRFILAFTDFFLINVCFFVSYYLSNKYISHIPEHVYRQNILTCNLMWLTSAGFVRLYMEDTISKLENIYSGTWRSVALHGVLFMFYLFFTNTDFSRYFLVCFYTFLIVGFILSRFTGTALEAVLSRYFGIRRPVAVLGNNQGARKFAAYLEQQPSIHFHGFLGDEDGYYIDSNGELLPAAVEQLKMAAESGVKDVYVSLTPERMGDAPFLLKEAEKQCVRLKFVPDLTATTAAFKINHMGEFPILSVRDEPLEDIRNRFQKRLFDIVFSLLVITFVLSWLYPILALIIKIQSPGPVLFKQLRSGRDNQPFWCYKFRSMKLNKESDVKQASIDDDRVTPIGKFMRRTSIDELPQFFNVLFGDMSVVGPRPHMLKHTEKYRALIDQYMVRQFLKPGITGWAQVNGYRGETRDDSLMKKRVEYDIWYMERWSAMLDVRIIFLTILNILKGEKTAY